MPVSPEAIVARARKLVGTRFRPHGRTEAEGLDCIGLVALAIDARDVPRDYTLRSSARPQLAARLEAAGLVTVEPMVPGDILVFAPRQDQLHLGIFTGIGLVHGDAALRRVAERPLPLPWPVLDIWRPREWPPLS